jgi:hypothetical protein
MNVHVDKIIKKVGITFKFNPIISKFVYAENPKKAFGRISG